jgi:hypothetical protein
MTWDSLLLLSSHKIGAHTILGDSKGMTVLDAKKDWRFEKSPLAEAYGVAFYAGVSARHSLFTRDAGLLTQILPP